MQLEITKGLLVATQRAKSSTSAAHAHIASNSMQLATGSDLTTWFGAATRRCDRRKSQNGLRAAPPPRICLAELRCVLAVLYARCFHVNVAERIDPPPPPPPPTHVEPMPNPSREGPQGRPAEWPFLAQEFVFNITDVLAFDSEARPLAGLRVEFSQAHLLLGA